MNVNRALMPLVLALSVFLVQCSKDDPVDAGGGGGGGQEVLFTLTPASPLLTTGAPMPPYTVTERYAFHCIDETEPDCLTAVYEDVPDESGDWMSFPITNLTCVSFFAEIRVDESTTISLTGQRLRNVGGGVGPFATGNYQRTDGTNFEFGTFTLNEQQLSGAGTNACPSSFRYQK